jgi:hypothetical protein
MEIDEVEAEQIFQEAPKYNGVLEMKEEVVKRLHKSFAKRENTAICPSSLL